jgi:hypothetical protein
MTMPRDKRRRGFHGFGFVQFKGCGMIEADVPRILIMAEVVVHDAQCASTLEHFESFE